MPLIAYAARPTLSGKRHTYFAAYGHLVNRMPNAKVSSTLFIYKLTENENINEDGKKGA